MDFHLPEAAILFAPPKGASWCLSVVGTMTSDRLVRIDTASKYNNNDNYYYYSSCC